jgi:hypothetical protein
LSERSDRQQWVAAFFAISACSWMPHWACHYYRLETGTTFIVGDWSFSRTDSVVAMMLYTLLVGGNVIAVARAGLRPLAGIVSGILHLAFAALHVARLAKPFPFEVFGYTWSKAASAREIVIVGSFGAASILIGLYARQQARRHDDEHSR